MLATPLQWQAFQAAWRDQQHLLPPPDVVIAGAGTRVYYSAPSHWQEDLQFRALLDQGWDLARVKALMAQLRRAHGGGNVALAGDQHQSCHRLRAKVKATVFDQAAAEFDRRARDACISYRSSSSRQGSWVLWDVVPAAAGVGSALQHVEQVLGWRRTVLLAASSAEAVAQLQQGIAAPVADAALIVPVSGRCAAQAAAAVEARGGDDAGMPLMHAGNLLDALELCGLV